MAGGVLDCPLAVVWQCELGGERAACTWTGNLCLTSHGPLPGLNKLDEGTFPRSQAYRCSQFSKSD